MFYRAVGNRCAIHFPVLRLPIDQSVAIEILRKKKFRVVEVDLIALARSYVGVSRYRRGARLREAPNTFDCSSLIKWLYGQCGIWLPRRSIQQREHGEIVAMENIRAGDVVFASGWINYYDKDPVDGVGHVGIASGEGSVIHAANSKAGIIESSLESFVSNGKFRGAKRYIPDQGIIVLEIPYEYDVETSDDVRWIILQSLK